MRERIDCEQAAVGRNGCFNGEPATRARTRACPTWPQKCSPSRQRPISVRPGSARTPRRQPQARATASSSLELCPHASPLGGAETGASDASGGPPVGGANGKDPDNGASRRLWGRHLSPVRNRQPQRPIWRRRGRRETRRGASRQLFDCRRDHGRSPPRDGPARRMRAWQSCAIIDHFLQPIAACMVFRFTLATMQRRLRC